MAFGKAILHVIATSQVVGIKAGKGRHRVIAVWAVVVKNRVFIRSWSLKPHSWFYTFKKERIGQFHVGSRKFRIRAGFVRSRSLKDAVSRAYAEKYNTPSSRKFVRDMSRPRSRNTTTELVPLD